MSYFYELFKKENQTTTKWSGGTTTQLAIFPSKSKYSDRNFHWRISTANVVLEESTFTSLPGYWRLLMIIEGELKIEHTEHHSAQLKPYDKDSFDGEWITRSIGKVRDFNLMMDKGYDGELKVLNLYKNENEEFGVQNDFIAIYCTAGKSIAVFDQQVIMINEGDFLLFSKREETDSLNLFICNDEDKKSNLIISMISKKE